MKTVKVNGRELKVPKLDDSESTCCSGTVRAECEDVACYECIYNHLWKETEHEE